MYGAILGDIIGSRFEFNNIKTKNFELFDDKCQFTDDTILTCAAADWIVNGGNAEDKLVSWAKKYIHNTNPAGHSAFSSGFTNWVNSEHRSPYQAKTNGCLMRISPVPFAERNTQKAIKKAIEFTSITHNHPESINAVSAYVEIIHASLNNCPNLEIINIGKKYGYDFTSTVDIEREKMDKFYYSCKRTFAPAIICVINANSYEDAIRNAVSLGGDTDTLACIAGAVAEAKFGIPEDIAKQGIRFLDTSIKNAMLNLYKTADNQHHIMLINHDRHQR
ncbi:MAG: ADP-ribosylglycohydrolase family protein [Alphaproteobacteria bacterium]|nr:ADP-ribosylglycohydrolase family protein [Alphaproteobacteria bacterium]